jgi:hypothetical protein
VLRRIFVSKKAEVSEHSRILHNEEFHDLYRSPNTLRFGGYKEHLHCEETNFLRNVHLRDQGEGES